MTRPAAAVADGADCIDGVGQRCHDREHVFGAKATTATTWRLVDERIDAAHLPRIWAARAAAWQAGAALGSEGWLHIDVDATLSLNYSDNKVGAASTWKKTFGYHPLLEFLDRPEGSGGEALAGMLRNGNAGPRNHLGTKPGVLHHGPTNHAHHTKPPTDNTIQHPTRPTSSPMKNRG